TWVTSTADYKRASRFSLTQPSVTVNALAAYVDGLGLSSGSQAARGVIYADDGTRVCQTSDTSVSAGDAASWKTMPISGTCTLAAGAYWLALHTGGPTEGVLRYNVANLAGGLHHDADLFSDGPASTFGAASTADWQLAIYASYTPNVRPTVTWAKPL